ncbi:MAG: T9SS type A sorting domain-containing protein, partial [Bacteroidota bacterium]
AASTTYRLEFFTSNTAAQGKTFIGSTTITTDAAGFYALNEVLPVTITAAEPVLTATATDPLGNTSEFGVEIVLDLELSSFTVETLSFGKALLNWEIEGIEPATYFEIEHKSPTQDFLKLGEQKDYVSLNQSKLYQFEVDDLGVGKHYFRLVQVNEGGVRSYSKSLELEITQDASHQVWIPNPLNSNSSLRIMVQKSQSVEISLADMSGKNLGNVFTGDIEGGLYQNISLEKLGNLSQGIYVLSIKGRGFRLNRKVILE